MAIRRCCCRKQGQWSHNKEMCHEKIHRCSRVDLADRRAVAHPDCKRSPRVAVELLIRKQRLLTTSRARERFRLRLDRTCIRKPAALHSRGGQLMCRGASLLLQPVADFEDFLGRHDSAWSRWALACARLARRWAS